MNVTPINTSTPKQITRPLHPRLTVIIFIIIALITHALVIIELFTFDIPALRTVTSISLPVAILLVIFYGVLFFPYILIDRRPRLVNLILALQTGIIIALAWITIRANTNLSSLLLPLAVFSTFLLRFRTGVLWLLLFFGLTQFSAFYKYGFEEGISTLAAFGGFAAFGFVGYLVRRSNLAYYTIESLYTDLESAHSQLTDYSKSVRRLAVSEERNRMSREMHDSLGHSLTVAVVQLEGAERLIPKDPERAASIIDSMRSQLKGALGELRQTLSTLRTEEVEEEQTGNLAMALTELKQNFIEATGLEVTLELPDNMPGLASDQRHALFRAAQEGLTNIQRHAQATKADLYLLPDTDEVKLIVRDNGVGLPKNMQDGRFGLRGLGERARLLNGSCEISNRPEGGTELVFKIPYEGKG